MGNVTSQDQVLAHNNKRKQQDNNNLEKQSDKIIHPLLSPVNSKTSASVTMTDNNNMRYNDSLQDVSMSGTSSANLQDQQLPQPVPRRRSTMILTDDPENQPSHYQPQPPQETQSTQSSEQQVQQQQQQPEALEKIPIEINWLQGGENVFITGSFTGWRKMIKLNKESDEKFSIKLKLPVGTHRFRFIVDNELRFSDFLPTATDQMGNFVNYIEVSLPSTPTTSAILSQDEVSSEQHNNNFNFVENNNDATNTNHAEQNQTREGDVDYKVVDDDDMGNGYSRFHEEENAFKVKYSYSREIPKIFIDPSVMEQYYNTVDNGAGQQQSWLTPPQLPPHLENVILNNFQTNDKNNNSGALPIPNHVVLNHLATTSIKHNTLAVASVVRYKRKYVTQVLYAPLQ